MKILILYFSGTGNTKWVVEYFSECLIKKSHNVNLYEISIGKLKDNIEKYDIVGIAHPIYGVNMPNIVYDFLEINPAIKSKVQFVITTYGYLNGFGYFAEKKIFRNIKWYFNIKMFNNISTPEI